MVMTGGRKDPYKNFKFRVALGAAIGGLAGYLTNKAVARSASRGVRPDVHRLLPDMGRRPQPYARWEDLALAPRQVELLRNLVLGVRRETGVGERSAHWKKGAGRRAVLALFAGPIGSGKSMAAEVLADELQVNLLRVDSSKVVSKSIGETEKNLQRVFSAARKTGAILLLGEADALFGKRSEVKDSHDRYANLEVSYLLERMEAHDGLIILATNYKQSVDAAFLRRLRFIVEFAPPAGAQPLKKRSDRAPADRGTETP